MFNLREIPLAPVPAKLTRIGENKNGLVTSPEIIEVAKKRKLVKEKKKVEVIEKDMTKRKCVKY
jgi:hypothetical protein